MVDKTTKLTSLSKTVDTQSEQSRRAFLRGAGTIAVGGSVLASTNMLAAINNDAQAAGEPIPLGGAVPLTGWGAADGIEYKRGIELACEHINAVGGVLGRPLVPHFEDTKTMGAENVIPAMQRLIDRHEVHGIVCGYNAGTGNAEYDVIADDGVIYIHANTDIQHHQTVKKDQERYFSIFMNDPAEYWYGEGLLKFLANLEASGNFTAKNKKLALVQGSDNYGIVIGSAIKEKVADYGWEISMTESVSPGISEWGPTISKLRENPPGVVAFTHWVPQDLAQFMLQFAPNPTDTLVYMQYGPSISAFREIAKEASEGVVYSTVAQTIQDEIGNTFIEQYRSAYGEDASPLNGGIPYDGTFLFAIAAALAGGSGAPGDMEQNRKVADKLRGLIYRGVLGTTKFFPDVQAAIPYPDVTNDPSLGMAHQYAQIQDWQKDPQVIAPWPYETATFATPRWMKG